MPMRHRETARSACVYYVLHACVCVCACIVCVSSYPLAAEPRDRAKARSVVNRRERSFVNGNKIFLFLFSWLTIVKTCGGVLILPCGGTAPVRSTEVRMIYFVMARHPLIYEASLWWSEALALGSYPGIPL